MIDNELRTFIRDFLNLENSLEELLIKFDLKQCESCENYELIEDIEDTSHGEICESCKNDIDI